MQDLLLEQFKQNPSISTDTRKVKPGDLFFGIKGDNFDGNTFAKQALEKGASWAVIDNPAYHDPTDKRYILVEDSLRSIQQLAHDYRQTFDIPFIAITGSNGKTTTKELLLSALQTEKNVFGTQGNFNNHLGVPLTLLSIPQDADIAIIEMGANQPGDIIELAEIANPTHGLITNIGKAHLERLIDLNGVQRAKGELFDYLGSHQGVAFINRADMRIRALAEKVGLQIPFGTPASGRFATLVETSLEGMQVDIKLPAWDKPVRFTSGLSGDYNVSNILSAVCVAHEMGISQAGIQAGIAAYTPTNNRSEVTTFAGHTIWLDAYNANPNSMRAAITHIFRLKKEKIVLVLGDMFELGAEGDKEHTELGHFINDFSPYHVVGIGKQMKMAIDVISGKKSWYETTEAAKASFEADLEGCDLVLVKGSRGMALEGLVK